MTNEYQVRVQPQVAANEQALRSWLADEYGFDVRTGFLGVEVVPSKELVEHIIHLSLSNDILYPGLFNFFIRENLKKQVDIVNIQIKENIFNQQLVGNGFHFRHIVRPETIFFFKLTKQLFSDVFIHLCLQR